MKIRLRYWRKKRGLTLKELASKVDLSFQLIGKYERGEVSPTLKRLEALARELDVTVADLLPRRSRELTQQADIEEEEAAHVG